MNRYINKFRNYSFKTLNKLNNFPFRYFIKDYGFIFLLHRVRPSSSNQRLPINEGLEIRPEQLDEMLYFLKRQDIQLISLDSLYEIIQAKKINQKFAVFTLDDGYYDNYQYAYPIFKKHNVPFTIYISNSFINQTANMWWYSLEETILRNSKLYIEDSLSSMAFDLNTPSQKQKAFIALRQLFLENQANKHEVFEKLLIKNYEIIEKDLFKTMDWEDIRVLSNDSIVTIGAHTINHFPLSKLSPEELQKEILESINEIESKIERKISHFSYPFGSQFEASEREYSFIDNSQVVKTATTSINGFITNERLKEESFKYQIPRIFISNQSNQHYITSIINGSKLLLDKLF